MDHRENLPAQKTTNEEWLSCTIGNFGKWQCWISLLLALFKFPIAWVQMSIIFLAPPTEYWCAAPIQYKNFTDKQWLQLSQPVNESIKFNQLNNGYCTMKSLENNNITNCLYGYDYNKTIFKSTIITEWDLICGKERLVDVSQIILMTGILVGNIVFGFCADRYGRKIVLIMCIVLQTICGFLASWSPYFWGFVFTRFLLAVANGGTLVVSFVMCIEIVGGRWRSIIPILIQAPFGIGYSLMALISFYIRDWRQFHFTISIISSVFLWYIWLIPESPRWLFVKGRRKEAKAILERAAKYNGIKTEIFQENFKKLSNFPEDSKKPKFSDLFSTSQISRRITWLSIIWLFSGMSFFTISQYIGHVGQNIFLSTAAGGLLSVPGQLICLYMISKFGRRNTVAFWSLITAICFLSIILFPKGKYAHDWQRMTFAGAGIIGISISLCALYLFTGELLPTVVRNTGLGLCSVCTRIGSMLAPLIIALHDISPSLPLVVLGILGIIQTCLVLMLPETKGVSLPELISDLDVDKRSTRGVTKNDYIMVATNDHKV